MKSLRRLIARIMTLVRGGRADADVRLEIASHLALLEDEFRRRGLSADAARREARLAFGGVDQAREAHRAARTFMWADDARRDFGYALRIVRRHPLAVMADVLSLALGIGVTAAVYTVFDWVVLRPLPFPQPDRLVRVYTAGTAPVTAPAGVTQQEFTQFDASSAFVSAAAFNTTPRVLSALDIQAVHVVVARVSGDLFGTLGVVPAIGRDFVTPELDRGAPVVVLSHPLWRRVFHEDRAIVGRPVAIDGVVHSVIGVAPPDRLYPPDADLWRPFTIRERDSDDDRDLDIIGRLRSTTSLEAAAAELSAIERASTRAARTAWPEQLHRADARDVRAMLEALLVSAGLILVLVCANLATLLGARWSDRTGEMTIRSALGATRVRLLTQLMTETVMVAVAGGAIGLLAGSWLLRMLLLIAPPTVPRLAEIALDPRIIVVGLVASLAAGVVTGALPALRLSGARGAGFQEVASNRTTRRLGARRVLGVVQVAIAVALTAAGALLSRSLSNMLAIDNGFDADRVVAVDLSLRGIRADTGQLFTQLVEEAESVPGAQSAAVSLMLPTQVNGLRAPTRVVGSVDAPVTATLRPVGARYFDVIGVTAIEGRAFTAADSQTAPAVAVVNRAFVRDVLHGVRALGARVTTPLVKSEMTIVGVVPDVTPGGERDRAALYVSADQVSLGGGFLLVRAAGDPRPLISLLAARLHTISPELAVDRIRHLQQLLEPARAATRFATTLVVIFAALALLLSTLGVYALAAAEVRLRWREIAIRLAFGASRRSALWSVVRSSAAVTGAGAAIGVTLAAATAPLLTSLLYGVRPTDAATLAVAAATLILVGIIAAVVGSVKVLSAAPAQTLRAE